MTTTSKKAKVVRYKPTNALEQRKAWAKDTAARLVLAGGDTPSHDETARRAQAYRAVDMACLIWDCVEGRFTSGGNGKGGDDAS